MSRPQKNRKVDEPPKMLGFKPFGIAVCDTENVVLHYDEFEVVRLLNYDKHSQITAAEKMGISQPTLTRVYNKALKKITKAFVEGKIIIIEGGNFEFEKDWYKCQKCFKLIEGLENHVKCADCNRFGEDELVKLNTNGISK
jgi:predicted DNA-binding protein (UPF0251 family)